MEPEGALPGTPGQPPFTARAQTGRRAGPAPLAFPAIVRARNLNSQVQIAAVGVDGKTRAVCAGQDAGDGEPVRV